MATRRLLVEIVGDDASLQRSLKTAGATTESFGKKMIGTGMSMVKAFAPIVATFAAADFAKGAIEGAEHLKLAQESLDVAIKHTGGNVDKLTASYTATAKAAAQFGMTQEDATRALAKATLLTGDAEEAQRAYEEALVISKATGKDFNSVIVATSKAQEGMTTSLKRYGILIDSTTPGQEQLNQVMARFGGQAEANTSATEKLHATFSNLQTSIGTLLLPTFEKIVEAANRWISNAHNQKTVMDTLKAIIEAVSAAFRVLKTIIETVDRVTGSFANTVKIVIALAFAAKIAAWTGAIRGLIARLITATVAERAFGSAAVVAGAEAQAAGVKARIAAAAFGGLAFLALPIHGVPQDVIDRLKAKYGGNQGPQGPGGPIPGHAAGGIFTQPHLAWIAENGPEAVVPLTGPNRGLGMGGVVINMNGTYIGGKRQLEEEIVNGLSRWARRNGNSQLRTALGVGG